MTMELLFEKSRGGRGCDLLPPLDVPPAHLMEGMERKRPLRLPQIAEVDLSRHYSALERRSHGVNDGFYPLGSCTMKYDPKVDDEMAALPGFAGVHPLQGPDTVQGCLEVLYLAEELLCEITGMEAMTFQPAAGAHGEFTALLMVKKYHQSRGDAARTKVIVPDSAHGTNPASAAMCGFTVVNVPSDPKGGVDLEALRAAMGPDVAALMLTNPNTLGLFDANILEITQIVHDAGGLCYYDGANLNAVMGVVRPGDMGFDLVHLNLHKTFATPHGGGGPGAGPVGCKGFLKDFLPAGHVEEGEAGLELRDPAQSIGRVKSFYGNFGVVVRALTYILTLGAEGIREAAQVAVLNANYLREQLRGSYDVAYGDGPCMHEFVLTLEGLKKETGISAMDVSKALLDHGIHPPTMYFPLIVDEALMFEPTETESRETLDHAAQVLREIRAQADREPEALHTAPHHAAIGRPDEVNAARHPVLRYVFPEDRA